MNKFELATLWVKSGHESIDQRRKYDGAPYFNHPERVEAKIRALGYRNEDVLIGVLAHDVFEDVYPLNKEYSPANFHEKFGAVATRVALGLTDRFSKEAYPKFNRLERNHQERIRLSLEIDAVKMGKASDILDNLSDISQAPHSYAVKYIEEKKWMMQFLRDSEWEAWNGAERNIFDALDEEIKIVINKNGY